MRCPTRTGRVVRLIDGTGQGVSPSPDPALIAMLVRARTWWAVLAEGRSNIKALARQEGVTPSWMTRIVRLAFLSPAVVEAILSGRLRADVSGTLLVRPGAVPECWRAQQALYLPAA